MRSKLTTVPLPAARRRNAKSADKASIRVALLALPLLLVAEAGSAAEATGNSALALAALVAAHAPALPKKDKCVMAKLFDGKLAFSFPAGRKISIEADKIACSAGDVDISHHACELTFGPRTVALSGRAAHEIYATLIEVGVPSDGAAGTIHETLSQLKCVIDPNEIKNRDGGGADCKF